jgi:hypothetical protein
MGDPDSKDSPDVVKLRAELAVRPHPFSVVLECLMSLLSWRCLQELQDRYKKLEDKHFTLQQRYTVATIMRTTAEEQLKNYITQHHTASADVAIACRSAAPV